MNICSFRGAECMTRRRSQRTILPWTNGGAGSDNRRKHPRRGNRGPPKILSSPPHPVENSENSSKPLLPLTFHAKNKVQNHVTFLDAKNMTAKTPRQPCKSPHRDHQNTTPKHALFAKTPAKPPLHHKQKNLSENKKGRSGNRRTAHLLIRVLRATRSRWFTPWREEPLRELPRPGPSHAAS